MRKILYFVFLLTFFYFGTAASVTAQANAKLSINLADQRKLFTRDIGKTLQLRVTKDSSVSQKDFCWNVLVVHKPARRNSANLVYSNAAGVTADPSQICAWQVPEQYFPNERSLTVKGSPYWIKIVLIDPKTAGTEANAGFVSGTLEISVSN